MMMIVTGEAKNRNFGNTDLEIPAYHPFVDSDPGVGAGVRASASATKIKAKTAIDTSLAALALVIILDQFSRNLLRAASQKLAYNHYDRLARSLCADVIATKIDQAPSLVATPVWRYWFAMPLCHCESLEDQAAFAAYLDEMERACRESGGGPGHGPSRVSDRRHRRRRRGPPGGCDAAVAAGWHAATVREDTCAPF